MRNLLIATAAALTFATSAQAQESAPAAAPIEGVRSAMQAGDMREARRLAAGVAREAAAPAAAEALWLIAQMEYADGDELGAAGALDRVAEHAAAYGDPVLQVRALVEATTLYATARRMDAAAERTARLVPLLDSPHLPAELKAAARSRLHL